MLTGFRHSDIIKQHAMIFHEALPPDHDQGFMDSKGNYVDREKAFIIARDARQMINQHHPKLLFSEDLY
jgi:hypothetical protein